MLWAISRSRAAELKAVKRLGRAKRHSEASAFCEQRRAAEGQVNGCPFWFVFGQAKMNKNN
jgi:hypothetical protein